MGIISLCLRMDLIFTDFPAAVRNVGDLFSKKKAKFSELPVVCKRNRCIKYTLANGSWLTLKIGYCREFLNEGVMAHYLSRINAQRERVNRCNGQGFLRFL